MKNQLPVNKSLFAMQHCKQATGQYNLVTPMNTQQLPFNTHKDTANKLYKVLTGSSYNFNFQPCKVY